MHNKSDKLKRKFKTHDLTQLNDVGSPLLCPNGKYLLYNLESAHTDLSCKIKQIILINLKNNQKKTIAIGTLQGWSPNGTEFAYESKKGELAIFQLETKRVRILTQINHSSHFINHLAEKNIIWSPDGKFLAYLHSEPQEPHKDEKDLRIINTLSYKTKGGMGRPSYNDNRLTHIYVIPAAEGEPILLTDGPFNEHSISWSPDSSEIAFISNRTENSDDNQFLNLWKVTLETKKVTRLTDDCGTAFQPKWSPDGQYIAYLATSKKISTNDSTAEDTHIRIISSTGGKPEYISKSLDRRIENIRWNRDSKRIHFTAGDKGCTTIYQIFIKSRKIETLIDKNACITEYNIHPNGVDFAYVMSCVDFPSEIFLTKNKRQNTVQISYENDELIRNTKLQTASSFWFPSFDETLVQGWLIKPVDFDTKTSYPLVLVIHGGPHNMFGNEFDLRMQLLSSAGYAVLYINPRGSHGYGQAFTNGNLLNWGGGDYKDLMLGVDFVLKQNKWIDKDRLGVTGQSYGGYMTNWIITQTNRFKAAVSDGGISNLVSFSGTSLYHSLMESEFNGRAFKNYALLWQWSPLRNISNVSTPTLILHGETDNEVPLSQADEMYVGLKKCNVETTYVQYIGEGHGWRPDLTPKNRQDINKRMIDWFNKYIPS